MLLVLYDFLHFVHWNGRSFLQNRNKLNHVENKKFWLFRIWRNFETHVCDRIWMVSSPCCLNVLLHIWHLKRLSCRVRKCVISAFFEKNFLSEKKQEIEKILIKPRELKSVSSWNAIHTAFMAREFLFLAKVFEMRLKVIVRLEWLATV